MARGDGAFVIAALCERVAEEGSANEKSMLNGWFTRDVRREIGETGKRGSTVLLEKLAALE